MCVHECIYVYMYRAGGSKFSLVWLIQEFGKGSSFERKKLDTPTFTLPRLLKFKTHPLFFLHSNVLMRTSKRLQKLICKITRQSPSSWMLGSKVYYKFVKVQGSYHKRITLLSNKRRTNIFLISVITPQQ